MVKIWSDQPFTMFHRQMKKIHPIFDFFDKDKYLAQNLGNFAPSKKGLIKFWIRNSIAVRVYFWALFANLDFPNSLLAP